MNDDNVRFDKEMGYYFPEGDPVSSSEWFEAAKKAAKMNRALEVKEN